MDSEGFKIPPPPDMYLHHSPENRLENHSEGEGESKKRANEDLQSSSSPPPKKKKGI